MQAQLTSKQHNFIRNLPSQFFLGIVSLFLFIVTDADSLEPLNQLTYNAVGHCREFTSYFRLRRRVSLASLRRLLEYTNHSISIALTIV